MDILGVGVGLCAHPFNIKAKIGIAVPQIYPNIPRHKVSKTRRSIPAPILSDALIIRSQDQCGMKFLAVSVPPVLFIPAYCHLIRTKSPISGEPGLASLLLYYFRLS